MDDKDELPPARSGRIVVTPGAEHPYKVVLDFPAGPPAEIPVSSIRDGEALIREQTRAPRKREGLRHWNPLG